MSRPLGRLLAFAGLGIILGAYACDVGHGFVKDDFGWILSSRDLSNLLNAPTGFFRPVVSLSFAIDYALFDLRPFGYGLTNLALLLACTVLVAGLLRAIGARRGVAALPTVQPTRPILPSGNFLRNPPRPCVLEACRRPVNFQSGFSRSSPNGDGPNRSTPCACPSAVWPASPGRGPCGRR